MSRAFCAQHLKIMNDRLKDAIRKPISIRKLGEKKTAPFQAMILECGCVQTKPQNNIMKTNIVTEKNIRQTIRIVIANIGATPVNERKRNQYEHIGEIDDFHGLIGIGFSFERNSWFVSVFVNGMGSELFLNLSLAAGYPEIAEKIEALQAMLEIA